MPDGRGHVTDLAFLALAQDDLQPGGGDRGLMADGDAARGQVGFGRQELRLGRRQQLPFDGHARAQRGQGSRVWGALHLHQIGLGPLVPGVGQPVGQVAVVGEQQQPFAVRVQPAGRVDPRHGDVVSQRRPSLRAGAIGQHAVGLEEEQIAKAHQGIVSGHPVVACTSARWAGTFSRYDRRRAGSAIRPARSASRRRAVARTARARESPPACKTRQQAR